mmetsp:Transcript_42037/g.125872  ORF Transcript_42037/g.125872 Transcript_42037/m.125872 type:complete len:166 (+) Transcript_42037:317-814(+)
MHGRCTAVCNSKNVFVIPGPPSSAAALPSAASCVVQSTASVAVVVVAQRVVKINHLCALHQTLGRLLARLQVRTLTGHAPEHVGVRHVTTLLRPWSPQFSTFLRVTSLQPPPCAIFIGIMCVALTIVAGTARREISQAVTTCVIEAGWIDVMTMIIVAAVHIIPW